MKLRIIEQKKEDAMTKKEKIIFTICVITGMVLMYLESLIGGY